MTSQFNTDEPESAVGDTFPVDLREGETIAPSSSEQAASWVPEESAQTRHHDENETSIPDRHDREREIEPMSASESDAMGLTGLLQDNRDFPTDQKLSATGDNPEQAQPDQPVQPENNDLDGGWENIIGGSVGNQSLDWLKSRNPHGIGRFGWKPGLVRVLGDAPDREYWGFEWLDPCRMNSYPGIG